MLTISELTAVLRDHRLRLSKRLGQHHLIHAPTIERIADQCQLSATDTVVEIGAGLGALTGALARRAGRVIAVENDRRIAALLAERMRAHREVEVICQDILEFAWERASGATVVGAIPYHITSPILVSLCEHRHVISGAILIVQAEVANRLVAAPSTKAYGRLSVLGQYCWRITPLLTVSRSAFFPQPDVDSRCVRLSRWDAPAVQVADEAMFFAIVKAAFSQRRKTLVNCLSQAGEPRWPRARVEEILSRHHLPRAVRGEALSLAQFAALTNALID